MVNSISSVNGATPTTAAAAVSSTTAVEQTAKEEEQAKKAEEQPVTLENKAEKNNTRFDRITLQNMVHSYIERLKKANDYPMVISRLDDYLALFNIDKFMVKYPNISSESDFNSIMYNETSKYL